MNPKKLLLTLLGGVLGWHQPLAAQHDHGHDHPHPHVERWTKGHGDIGIAYEGGALALHLHASTGSVINGVTLTQDEELPPDETRIILAESGKQTAAAALAPGAGVAEGDPLWVLPGTHSPNSGLPFLGFGAEELTPADWAGDLRFTLHEVVSPSGRGHFAVYSADGLGGFEFLMSTAQGGITAADHVKMVAGGHDHFFMSFSEPGTWKVTLKASGQHTTAGALVSEPVTFTFEVGERPSRWTSGHGDIGVAYEEGDLELHLHLEDGAVVNGTALAESAEPLPALVEIVVSNAAEGLASEELESGLGAHSGDPIWVLPVSDDPRLPFVGFGTEELDAADWSSNVTFKVVAVESPSGLGHFSAYKSDGLGGYTFAVSTHMGGLTEDDRIVQAAGTHDHNFLAFTEPGRWLVTFVASATHAVDGVVESAPVTFIFDVGSSTWTDGHGDIGLGYHDGELELHLHLHEGAVVDGEILDEDAEPDPASTLVAVSNAASLLSTPELAAGTGVAAGERMWVLPAVRRAGLPFVGFGGEELAPQEWTGDLHLDLVGVESPSGGGHFAVFQPDGLGGQTFSMSTAQGGVTGDDHLEIAAGEHDHHAFSFSEEGVWRITFVASGVHTTAGALASEPVTYTFIVGGSRPGSISFESEHFTASSTDDSVMVRLTRSDASQAAAVTLGTANGPEVKSNPPFSAAIVGRDYQAPAGAAAQVRFEVGESTKEVALNLLPPARPAVVNRHFLVSLSNPEEGAVLGTCSSATVRILAPDSRKPTLTLVSPVAGKVSAASPFLVTGSAGDALGLDRVEVALNGGAPVLAVLGSAAKPAAVPFTAAIEPIPGNNTVVVTAYDLGGNSTQLTRKFDFTTRYRLTLERIVPPGLGNAVEKGGAVAVVATPASAASVLMPRDVKAPVKTSDVLPGVPVVLTATAATGHIFSHWTGLPTGAVVAGAAATFSMPAAPVTVGAVFIANPFGVTANIAAGNAFQGILRPEGGTPESNATTGFVGGTMTTTSGSFSGQVMVNGLLVRFVAVFNGDGAGFFKVGRSTLPKLSFQGYELGLTFVPGAEGGHIAMDLTGPNGASSGLARRARHGRTAPVPASLLNSTTRGFYTFVLPAKDQTPALTADLYPQGAGFGSLTLDSAGSITYSGTLADGSKFTGSSFVTEGRRADLFVQLGTPGQPATVKGGSLGGAILFDPQQASSDVSGVDLFWYRPSVSQVDRPAAAAAATRLYTSGWPQGLKLDLVGALYDAKAVLQTALSLPAENPTSGNASLVLEHGKLLPEVEISLNIAGKLVKKLSASDKSYSLVVQPATGAFSGSFTPNWSSPARMLPVFQGVILQKGTSRGGYGFFISNAEGDLDPESGAVYLGGQGGGRP